MALGTQFEALLFMISIAFILLAMAKERAEQRHKTAAMIDPLAAVIPLDLDNFKSINDRHGQAACWNIRQSDESCLRRSDLFGRLGGEEFAAMLHDTNHERAIAVAAQIRISRSAVRSKAVQSVPP